MFLACKRTKRPHVKGDQRLARRSQSMPCSVCGYHRWDPENVRIGNDCTQECMRLNSYTVPSCLFYHRAEESATLPGQTICGHVASAMQFSD